MPSNELDQGELNLFLWKVVKSISFLQALQRERAVNHLIRDNLSQNVKPIIAMLDEPVRRSKCWRCKSIVRVISEHNYSGSVRHFTTRNVAQRLRKNRNSKKYTGKNYGFTFC